MGLQISRSIYPEEAKENDIWSNPKASWRDIARVGCAKGMSDSGRAFDVRSCAYLHQHTAEALGLVCDGYIKGKSAISIARRFAGKTKNFTGENFWARGYFVTTIGLDEEMVRAYVRNQDEEDAHYDQLKLGM